MSAATAEKGEKPASVPALLAPPREDSNPFLRSTSGLIGGAFLLLMFVLCLGTLPWTLSPAPGAVEDQTPWYNAGDPGSTARLPPAFIAPTPDQFLRLNALVEVEQLEAIAATTGLELDELREVTFETEHAEAAAMLRDVHPSWLLGTDVLGRSLLVRVLTGGGISLGIGIAAALISVLIGTLYGAISGYAGGKTDAVMMRIVDILFGLPYILLVVLLAVAVDAFIDDQVAKRVAAGGADLSSGQRLLIDVATLLIAIGGVSWLTMARVVRGQVLSLKNQPFVEAARAVGAPVHRIFAAHLLPNLLGPVIVYATLTVPQAILQESFLSFLGIGVKPPLPSWGNLAAEGLQELNTYKSHWWLLLFPCVLLGTTLLALNFVGEGLREALDPKRARG